mmetsp:Transcript_8913/g.26168  ORF Transcript_8913/g.26168 Transcript_8913/m.26168 type:complete len:167 (+) Transcript_8913:693-1193(+)
MGPPRPPPRPPPPRPPPAHPPPLAAPQGSRSRSATADYSEAFKRLVMAHALQQPKSGRVGPTCNKFSTAGRTLYPKQIRRWLNDRGLMVDVFSALQGAGLSLADDVEATLSAAGSSASPSGRRRRWRGRQAALGGPAFASRPHPGRGSSRVKPRSRRRRRRARRSR